jgi:hypothetical protein
LSSNPAGAGFKEMVLLFIKEGFPEVAAASGAKKTWGATAQVSRHEAPSLLMVTLFPECSTVWLNQMEIGLIGSSA